MKRTTRVLANWQPSKLDALTIQAEFVVMLGSKGLLSLGIPEVRWPGSGGFIDWHQDNEGQEALLAVWSNVTPTEVRFRNGRTLRAVDGDVILIQNDKVFHKTPARLAKGRWFARTFVRNSADATASH